MGAGTGIHPVAATGARPALAPMCAASDRPSVTGQLRCLVKGEPDDQQPAFGGDPRRRVHCSAMALDGALERAPDDRSCRHGPGAVTAAGPAREVATRAVDAPSREDAGSGTRGVGGASRGVVPPHSTRRTATSSRPLLDGRARLRRWWSGSRPSEHRAPPLTPARRDGEWPQRGVRSSEAPGVASPSKRPAW